MRATWIPAIAAGAVVALTGSALAAALAPTPPLSKDGKDFFAMAHKAPPQCPDAGLVGVPAFPGSLCLGMTAVTQPGIPESKQPFPRIKLVSDAPPEKVQQWYAAHLDKSWAYDKKWKHFAHAGWSMRQSMRKPVVLVSPASKTGVFGAAFFELKDVKSVITIAYDPKGVGK